MIRKSGKSGLSLLQSKLCNLPLLACCVLQCHIDLLPQHLKLCHCPWTRHMSQRLGVYAFVSNQVTKVTTSRKKPTVKPLCTTDDKIGRTVCWFEQRPWKSSRVSLVRVASSRRLQEWVRRSTKSCRICRPVLWVFAFSSRFHKPDHNQTG